MQVAFVRYISRHFVLSKYFTLSFKMDFEWSIKRPIFNRAYVACFHSLILGAPRRLQSQLISQQRQATLHNRLSPIPLYSLNSMRLLYDRLLN